MKVLILGGAGFVGSHLARRFKERVKDCSVVAFDNLRRRGSEINLPRLKEWGVEFVHGDLRVKSDLFDLPGNFDLVVDCSAEPSVTAGLTGSPDYVLSTNLGGTLNCLEFVRTRGGRLLFLSTSRVYSIGPLKELPLVENENRLDFNEAAKVRGASKAGIAESFSTETARSLYGATKLCSEYFIQEYADTYNLSALINRCGVVAGPGQFGKVDQGVFTLWVARHLFQLPLKYTGFGGTGKQVRDLLHPEDLFDLLLKQTNSTHGWNAAVYNAGGGAAGSVSLKEMSAICTELTGNKLVMGSEPQSASVDIPWYVTDNTKVFQQFGWSPAHGVPAITRDILEWLRKDEKNLKGLFI